MALVHPCGRMHRGGSFCLRLLRQGKADWAAIR